MPQGVEVRHRITFPSLREESAMSEQAKILIIGLDGATLDLIEPWVAAGHLPNLAALMQAGQYARLNSVTPVVSAAAWATFMTGLNPGKHGVYDFVYREPSGYALRPVTRRHISGQSLWQSLSRQDRSVCVINVPMTYPPEPVNGVMVSGLGTPNYKTFTYPPELGDQLIQDGYQVNRSVYEHRGNEDAFLTDTYTITDGVTAAALSLLNRQPWDFFMVVYRDTDEMAHGFWHHMDPEHPDHPADPKNPYRDALRDYYSYLDGQVGQLVEAAGPDTNVLIVSDHGFGPLHKDVFLNEWLRQAGYLAAKTAPGRRETLSRLGITRSNISILLRGSGLGRVERLIKGLSGDRIALLPRTAWTDFSEGIDWSRTRAYSFGYQGQIYINLTGREPDGIVEPGADYEALVAELTTALMAMVDPEDGRSVVDKVELAATLYNGPFAASAPDLVVTMRGLEYMTRLGHEFDNQPGEIFGSSRWHESGGHRLDGTLIAAGPAFQTGGQEMPAAWLGDIAPTVLHLMGCHMSKDMDGAVLQEWLVSRYLQRPAEPFQDDHGEGDDGEVGLTVAEEEELLSRLRDLGYLG
jgi:predicted AlkP superfamily phosphohydrolase/phosphomutase